MNISSEYSVVTSYSINTSSHIQLVTYMSSYHIQVSQYDMQLVHVQLTHPVITVLHAN